MNYDPNLVTSGRMAVQTVRLTFGEWDYRRTVETTVGGDCRGLSVIEGALENILDELPEDDWEGKTITLEDEEGNELSCNSNEGDCEPDKWLSDMLISVEIIDIQPENGKEANDEGV